MNRGIPLLVATLFSASITASLLQAQSTNVKTPNKNESAKLKSVIVKGSGNLIFSNATASFIGGGQSNRIWFLSTNSVIGGGFGNIASNKFATIAGGVSNTASGAWSAVLGGSGNTASGDRSAIGGGFGNAAGVLSAVPGGQNNSAGGMHAFAAGRFARATNEGAFVWGSFGGAAIKWTDSTNANSVTIRAPGGVRFITTLVDSTTVSSGPYNTNNNTSNLTNGVYLAPNSGAWASLSDSNAKTKVETIKPREILAKLSSMPVTAWEYKSDPDRRRYIGPMAQDFHAAFGLGGDDKTISTLDSDGVMYAAIQGLVEELKERDETIKALKANGEQLKAKSAELDDLKARFDALERRISDLPPAP